MPQIWKEIRCHVVNSGEFCRGDENFVIFSPGLGLVHLRKLPHTRFLESTGRSLKMHVPKTLLPQMDFEWVIPDVWNAFERNLNRAYHILYSMLVAYENLLIAFDLIHAP